MSRSPEYWRMVQQEGITRQFTAKLVVELPNPGKVFEFQGQLYKLVGGQLVLCSGEERLSLLGQGKRIGGKI